MSFTSISLPVSKRFVQFFFKVFDRFKNRIHWSISAVLSAQVSKLCDRNTYDKLINLVADMNDFGKNYFKRHLMLIFELVLFRECLSGIASSYFFRPSKVTEHVTSRVSGSEFRIK